MFLKADFGAKTPIMSHARHVIVILFLCHTQKKHQRRGNDYLHLVIKKRYAIIKVHSSQLTLTSKSFFNVIIQFVIADLSVDRGAYNFTPYTNIWSNILAHSTLPCVRLEKKMRASLYLKTVEIVNGAQFMCNRSEMICLPSGYS